MWTLQKYLFCISDVAKMMFLSHPEGQLIGALHCQQAEPCCFSARIEGQVQFQTHVGLHSDTLKDAYIERALDKKNIQIKYYAKVQLLFRLVILSCQLHINKDYKYTFAKNDKIVLVLPSGLLLNYFSRERREDGA